MSYNTLKQNRASAIDRLRTAADKISGGGTKSYEDDRFWTPTIDKAGNGYAIIRFLPTAPGDDLPWVQYWDHGFKGPTGRWYIEKSLTSIGQNDPVSEANTVLWNSGIESDKETVRARKRRLHYVSNVLIVSDPGNPENNGKVKLFKYGKKIFDKLNDLMQPQFADETPINPFDFWDGTDFRLKIVNVEGYRNYDKSTFDKPSQLFNGDDEKLSEVYNQLHSLFEFIDPSKYKPYDELKKKYEEVVGVAAKQSTERTADVSRSSVGSSLPERQPASAIDSIADADEEDEGDSALSYFAQLAAK